MAERYPNHESSRLITLFIGARQSLRPPAFIIVMPSPPSEIHPNTNLESVWMTLPIGGPGRLGTKALLK